MSTWDNLKGSLFAAGRDVSQKAKEVSEVAKLKMDIHTKEDFVEKQFAALGRAYYEEHKENASEADAEKFDVIKEALEEIQRMNNQILDIQGVIQCPNCGKKVPSNNSFCSDCGAKLEVVIVEETMEETMEETEDTKDTQLSEADEDIWEEEVIVEEVTAEEVKTEEV